MGKVPEKSPNKGKHLTFLSFQGLKRIFTPHGLVWNSLHGRSTVELSTGQDHTLEAVMPLSVPKRKKMEKGTEV